MSVRFYMDVQFPGGVTRELRELGVSVLRAQDDGAATLPDEEIIDRATELGRVSVSQDYDFLRVAAARQRSGAEFSGVVFARQKGISYATLIHDLELIARTMNADQMRNTVTYLPFKT